jgi:hypothetical protein
MVKKGWTKTVGTAQLLDNHIHKYPKPFKTHLLVSPDGKEAWGYFPSDGSRKSIVVAEHRFKKEGDVWEEEPSKKVVSGYPREFQLLSEPDPERELEGILLSNLLK